VTRRSKKSSKSKASSPRADLADRIARFINDYRLNNPFGGDVTIGGEGRRKYRAILFAIPRSLDGLVRVYSPSFILVETSGPRGDGQHVFESEENVIDYIRKRWVENDPEGADEVPRREGE